MEFQTFTLPNGIRLIHEETGSEVAHCAFFVNAGSRDEKNTESGLAHFTEHLLFKGTSSRKAFHILSRMEDVGGEINAYTTKEETCIHTSFLKMYYERALELIADIVFRSSFADKAIHSEKEVIIEEINSYKDTPLESIFDEFEELVFNGHPLAGNILGTKKSIRKFKRQDILSFINTNYNTDQIVISSAGNIGFTKLCSLVSKHFGEHPENTRQFNRLKFTPVGISNNKIALKTHQAHCIIGSHAYGLKNKKRIGLSLLSNLLGGSGMTARLNMVLRENKGWAYNVESSYTPYTETGIFSIYFGTDKINLDKSLAATYKELRKLCDSPLGTMQLHRAKRQLIGQMAISSESDESRMMSYGKSFLVYNKVDSLQTVFKKIEEVSSAELMDISNEILNPNNLSSLIYT